MESSLPLVLTALSAGGLFLAAHLLLTGLLIQNKRANKWLGAFFLLLSLIFIQFLLQLAGIPNDLLIRLSEWPRWLIFPFAYFAVYAFVNTDRLPALWYIHLLPAIIFIAFSILNDIGWQFPSALPENMKWMVKYFFFFQGLFYSVLNLRILQSHRIKIRELLADKGSDLNWLSHIVLSPLYIALIWFLVRSLELSNITAQVIYLSFCFYFITAALRQRAVYPKNVDVACAVEISQSSADNAGKRLTKDQIELFKTKVHRIIESDKPHLDPDLNLKMLADRVGINIHELSLILNQGFGQNFYTFINHLRTKEAMELLESGKFGRGDMREIAMRSGFNSRSTFYSSIKKIKGVTPLTILKG